MAKKTAKDGRGRPIAVSPKSEQIAFRVDANVANALEKKRAAMNLVDFSLSATARLLLLQLLERDGLL